MNWEIQRGAGRSTLHSQTTDSELSSHPAKFLAAAREPGRARHSVRAETRKLANGAQGTDAPYLNGLPDSKIGGTFDEIARYADIPHPTQDVESLFAEVETLTGSADVLLGDVASLSRDLGSLIPDLGGLTFDVGTLASDAFGLQCDSNKLIDSRLSNSRIEPLNRSGVSVERRHPIKRKFAALCRDAATPRFISDHLLQLESAQIRVSKPSQ